MRTLLLLLVFAPMMGTVLEPCDRVRAFLKAWEDANERCGLRRKQMAAYQKLTEAQLSMQMALVRRAHPSLARAALAPDDVYINWAEGLCDLTGTARVVRDRKLDKLIHVVEMLEQRVGLPVKETL